MKNYKIEIKLKISSLKDSYGNTEVIGECELSKVALLPAIKVKDEATKLVRNAVAHFSESAALGLAESVESEPRIENEEQNTLTV